MSLSVKTALYGNPIDAASLTQLERCLTHERAVYGALMADHHKGYAVPIGGVIAYQEAISPSGVGYDIACGNKAIRTDASWQDVQKNIAQIMDEVWTQISFGMGRKNNERVDHELFDDIAWKLPVLAPLKELARGQLGTVGGGNHYVDIFVDSQQRIWAGVHFGSRGLGHKTATWFLKQAGAADGMDVDACVLDENSNLGAEYIEAMRLAGRYAYAGRDWVCAKVASILGARIEEEVHNHHNFAWREEHAELGSVWVVRKGATPAAPGQRGFVGGSMGEESVILEGVESAESARTLYSTVHGAGRVMGRLEAKGTFDRKTGEMKRPPKVTADMMQDWILKSGVELRGGGVDESPHCYKRLPDVLAAQGQTIRILERLKPIGVAMAGADEFDPYKD
jgi:tRNA-splicing ligase RtcB